MNEIPVILKLKFTNINSAANISFSLWNVKKIQDFFASSSKWSNTFYLLLFSEKNEQQLKMKSVTWIMNRSRITGKHT